MEFLHIVCLFFENKFWNLSFEFEFKITQLDISTFVKISKEKFPTQIVYFFQPEEMPLC